MLNHYLSDLANFDYIMHRNRIIPGEIMKTVNIGIIGCGGRLRMILNAMTNIGKDLQVAALCDPSTNSIAECKKVINDSPAVYNSAEQLCADDSIDWVMIGSHNALHREHAVAALEAGKDVFCEKPLAITLDDCLAIRDAVERSGKKFIIGFVLRYSLHYKKLKQLIDNGEIGSIISLEFNETLGFNHGGFIHSDWRRLRGQAGTHLLEKCCHDIDLINWLVQSRARRVASFGGLNFFKPENEYHISRLGKDKNGKDAYRTWPSVTGLNPFTCDKDIVDNQVAIIEYENDVRATFHTNGNAGIPERRMYILGTEGAIRADVLTGKIELCRIGHDEHIRDESTTAKGGHGDADKILGPAISRAMLNGEELDTGIEDGITSAATCFAIDEAMDSGKVVDMREWWEKTERPEA